MNELAVIYVLVDPRNGEIRYVGYTTRPGKRHKEDLDEATRQNNRRAYWIRALSKLGQKPIFRVLQKINAQECANAECYWIREMTRQGCCLVNGTAGGDGVVEPSWETRLKISTAQLGRKRSYECRAKISATLRGVNKSAETKRHMREAQQNRRPLTDEQRKNISNASKNRIRKPHTAETKLRMSQSAKARVQRVRAEEPK